jgi:hypothetical protein
MRSDEFLDWLKRRLEIYQEVPARVDAASLCAIILRAAQQIQLDGDEWITIPAAAEESGYTVQHIRRLIKEDKLAARGDGRARSVLRQALPRKVPKVAQQDENLHLFPRSAEQAVRGSVGTS